MIDLQKELNPMQAKAASTIDGPVLILAGAGSGKTRTIVYRMAHLIESGINPWNIMALTFTNKAAKEMKTRVEAMLPGEASSIWVSTFHSTCLRIMFRFAESLGYTSSFEIADASDQKSIMKDVYKRLEIDPKMYPMKRIQNAISSAKDELKDEEDYAAENRDDFGKEVYIEVYREYQKTLRKNNSMDFDDLIMNTVRLFRENKEALEYYQERFKYIMVDEYQDTNTAQFEMIRLLAGKYRNLCVVGDDDQSIYRFRGANIYNILDFEKEYKDALVIKLEENYRSTGRILDAANAVIAHNTERKNKKLWTAHPEGSLIKFRQLDSAISEASFIADDIKTKVGTGGYNYGDCAILIRTNVQSKELEDAFRVRGIDYDLVKGLRFWDTKVIKDLSSYLLTVADGLNDMRTLRVINVPKRGIGASSVEKAVVFGAVNDISLLEIAGDAMRVPGMPSKAANAMKTFYDMIMSIRADMKGKKLSEILDEIIEKTAYMDYLVGETETKEKYAEAVEYIDKLRETLDIYEEDTDEPDLVDFMRQNGVEGNALDKTGESDEKDKVLIMTMHNAKGLEFPCVYISGAEDGLFPSYMSLNSDDEMAVEEERRLCYVAITRAEKELMITAARQRMINGETRYSNVSRFIREIPIGLMDMNVTAAPAAPKDKPDYNNREIAARAFSAPPSALSPGFKKRTLQEPPKELNYGEGDRVLHFKFGTGTVKSIVSGGRDFEVTVEFDSGETKKMFAGFAKLKKV
ncbi:MAG: UvrD-helicase domain-containing protein [Lachnospiraceae bacterium]|nr:UvrD-helicase domain-containing protein [Lachnospiraceae bacterium]